LKGMSGDEIKNAVRLVASGHRVFQDEVFTAMQADGASRGDISFLSKREREIVSLVARGFTNKQAACELFLSEGTVKNYVSQILDKLGLSQRTQIAVYYTTGRKDFT